MNKLPVLVLMKIAILSSSILTIGPHLDQEVGYGYDRPNHAGILGIPWKTLGLCSTKAVEYSNNRFMGYLIKSIKDCTTESYVDYSSLKWLQRGMLLRSF